MVDLTALQAVAARLEASDDAELALLQSIKDQNVSLAAQLAASNPNRRKPIEAAFDELRIAAKSRDQKQITDSDLALHKAIVVLAGHKRLASQYGFVEQQVRMYMASSNAILERPELVISNHEKMVSSLLKGNAISAERHARDHNKVSGELLVRHLREQEAKLKDRVRA